MTNVNKCLYSFETLYFLNFFFPYGKVPVEKHLDTRSGRMTHILAQISSITGFGVIKKRRFNDFVFKCRE